MYTIEHLGELFGFNNWANLKLIASLKESDSADALKYLAHLLITEQEYFERLNGKDSTGFNFWPGLNLDKCETLARENSERFERLLGELDEEGLERKARYKTSEGAPHENTLREMLTHILFHSMAHRGQALTAIRKKGHEPPKIDYIIYLREKG
jgi:uncharacterized damage-inducible protein DinB